MKDTITLSLISNILPLLVALFFALRIFFLRGEKPGGKNYIALLFVLFIGIEFFGIMSQVTKSASAYLSIALFLGSTLALAPTINLAVNQYIGLKIKNKWNPFLLAIIASLVDFGLLVFALSLPKDHSSLDVIVDVLFAVNVTGLSVVFIVQNIFYLRKLYRRINEHERKLGSFYSFEEGVSLKWLKTLINGYLFFVILIIAISILEAAGPLMYTFELIVLVFILFIGIKSIHYHQVTQTLAEVMTMEEGTKAESEEDNEFNTSDVEDKELAHRLIETMEEKKPYLNARLTIQGLSRMVSTNYKYLSRHINNEYDMNFVSFVNSYRIKAAKEKLARTEYNKYTIEAIAEMVGFNSKSAFNSWFKKYTKKTPSQYRRQVSS